MKIRRTQLSKALLILGMLSCLSLHAVAQSVTTASTVSSAAAGKEQVIIYEPSTDAYWDTVGGDAFHYSGVTRTYYIAADEVVWDYAPDQTNILSGQPFTPAEQASTVSGPNRIGSKYMKCMFQEYTNAKFTTLKTKDPEDGYLGFFSPVIRAEVGDVIKVVFVNNCKFPTAVHPHGVFTNKANEGSPYNDGTSGKNKLDDAIQPGGKYTYTWPVPERCGPGPMDGSSVMWMYHGHFDEVIDFYAGLVGPIAITRKGLARPDATPIDVDRELFIMYSVANENLNPYLAYNFATFTTPPAGPNVPVPTDGGFTGSNNKDAINGFVYGNGPRIVLKKGQHVRWYVMSMGGGGDGHTPSWHGNVVLVNGNRQAMVSVEPGEMITADMCPDDVGTWLFHCHVNDHLIAGMGTLYDVVA